MELTLGNKVLQSKLSNSSSSPLRRTVTTSLKKDQGDAQSDSSYSGRRFSAISTSTHDFAWASEYVNAGPTFYKKYLPRVYACGALGLVAADGREIFNKNEALPLAVHQLNFGFPPESSQSYKVHLDFDSTSQRLRLDGPVFSASVKLIVALPPASATSAPEHGQSWEFGWIQGCLAYCATATYDNGGSITYKLPEYGMRTGGCGIAGSADFKPWYDDSAWVALGHEAASVTADSSTSLVGDGGHANGVRLRELTLVGHREASSPAFPANFFCGIEFCRLKLQAENARLTSIRLTQKYRAWIALRDCNSGAVVVFRSLTWSHDALCDGRGLVRRFRNAVERDSSNFFVPEITLEGASNLADSMQAVYSHPAWGDVRLDELMTQTE